MKYKNLHDINTFSCSDNEVYLAGKDENGKLPKNFYVALPPMISRLVKYDQPKGCIARCQID